MKDIIQIRTVSMKKKKEDSDLEEDACTGVIPEDGCYDHSLQDFEVQYDINYIIIWTSLF